MNGSRPRHLGELLLDLAIVVGSVLYVHAADNYPPQGRQMPVLIGYIAIGLGVLHLIAHAVPRLWAVTHDNAARGGTDRPAAQPDAVQPESAVAPDVPSEPAPLVAASEAGPEGVVVPPAPALKTSYGEPRQVMLAIAWVVGLLLGTWLLGYVVAIPLFFLAYFGVMRAWRTAVISAVVMGAITQGLFVTALAVPLPQGYLW